MTVLAVQWKKLSRCMVGGVMASACGCSLPAVAQPIIAHAHEVVTCRFVGDIQADSGYGKNADWRSKAYYAAMARGNELKATHLLVVRLEPVGAFNGVVFAKAFKCGS